MSSSEVSALPLPRCSLCPFSVVKLIAVMLFNSGRATSEMAHLVVCTSARPVGENQHHPWPNGWLSRAMNSIILALMDLAFWVVSLKLFFKWLLDLLTAWSTPQTLWVRNASCTYVMGMAVSFEIDAKLDIEPMPMLSFLANIVWSR
jgi:hypothetical protein